MGRTCCCCDISKKGDMVIYRRGYSLKKKKKKQLREESPSTLSIMPRFVPQSVLIPSQGIKSPGLLLFRVIAFAAVKTAEIRARTLWDGGQILTRKVYYEPSSIQWTRHFRAAISGKTHWPQDKETSILVSDLTHNQRWDIYLVEINGHMLRW